MMLPQNKVLIVDDEETIRGFCRAALLAEGFLVQTASGGQEALKALADDKYDLLLLDISMPDIDGLTVLEYVASQYTQVSSIMMTGYATLEAAIQAQDLGAEGFLLKPFDDQKLLQIIHKVLRRRTLRQDYARLQAHLPLVALSHRLFTEQKLEALTQAALQIVCLETQAGDAALRLIPPNISSPYRDRNWQDVAPVLWAHVGQPPALPDTGTWPVSRDVSWFAFDKQGHMTSDINRAEVLHLLLQTEGHLVGILSLANPRNRSFFTGLDLDFLTVMSRYLAVGLENRYLYETIDLARQEWETIFNTLDDGLLIHQANDGVIIQANHAMAIWLNTTVEILINQPSTKVPIDEEGCTLCRLAPPALVPADNGERSLGHGSSSAEFSSPPWAPGKSFRVRTFPIYKRSNPSDQKEELVEVVHVLEDITQANKMQAQLLQAEKLSALGRLSASLAHEINNPLQALRSGLRLLARPKLSDEKRQRYVTTLVKEVERLVDTTTRSLDFARPSRAGKKLTNVNQLLQETLALVRKQLQRNKIETAFDSVPDLPDIQVMPDQIKQVLLNLILNAIDAMPNGGHLRLTVGYSYDDNFIVITVVDTGEGISPEILDKIYEPFFSTKETGTGLGLSISYSIVEAHGGFIEVDSQSDRGSRFTVYLPIDLEGDYGSA